MKSEEKLLSRAECAALRGLAIWAIVLHNYCHWLGLAVKENEYQFLAVNNEGLWRVITHPDANIFVHLFSYFGHYGVPVFLFLSGFGLVMKYETAEAMAAARHDRWGWLAFLRTHYLKLFRLMIAGFVLFLLVDVMTPGAFRYHFCNVVAQLLMYVNLFDHPDKVIWPGPYWFFGLMMQLYIVYRLLLYRTKTEFVVLLIIACWMLQMFCDPFGETINRLRYNCIGGMLPFGAGIVMARLARWKPQTNYPRWSWWLVLMVSAAMLVLMCFHFQLWLWAPLMVVLASVALVKALPQCLLRVLIWSGGLSAAMFVTHPAVRKLFIPISRRGDVYDGLLLYVIVVIALSWLMKKVIDRIPQPKS